MINAIIKYMPSSLVLTKIGVKFRISEITVTGNVLKRWFLYNESRYFIHLFKNLDASYRPENWEGPCHFLPFPLLLPGFKLALPIAGDLQQHLNLAFYLRISPIHLLVNCVLMLVNLSHLYNISPICKCFSQILSKLFFTLTNEVWGE